MKPLPHSSSFHFFSFTLLMILIINIGTCLCQDDDKHTNCNTAFKCGNNIPDLKYPFWGDNREEFCGGVDDSNTKLTCEGSFLKITINDVKYRILGWVNTTQKLTVARDDYSNGDVCDVIVNDDSKNSTFDNTHFERYGDVANVTLFYGCVLPTGNLPNLYSAGCSDISVVYTASYSVSYPAFCTPTVTVVIPILGTRAAELGSEVGIIVT